MLDATGPTLRPSNLKSVPRTGTFTRFSPKGNKHMSGLVGGIRYACAPLRPEVLATMTQGVAFAELRARLAVCLHGDAKVRKLAVRPQFTRNLKDAVDVGAEKRLANVGYDARSDALWLKGLVEIAQQLETVAPPTAAAAVTRLRSALHESATAAANQHEAIQGAASLGKIARALF